MYKVVNCSENGVLEVVDVSVKDKCRYYVDNISRDIIYIDDNDNQHYVPIGCTVYEKVKFVADVYSLINDKRLYYSVYDLYILDFILYISHNLNLDKYTVVAIFNPYFNLIETCSKVLKNFYCDVRSKRIAMASIYYGIIDLYDKKMDLNELVPQYLKDVIYIYNNIDYTYVYQDLNAFTSDFRKAHTPRVFISKIKQTGIDIKSESSAVYLPLCMELIEVYKDKYIKFYIDIMKSQYIANAYYTIGNDNLERSSKNFNIFYKYIQDCEQKGITPRVSKKIINNLYNNKAENEINRTIELSKKLAASAAKYEWIEEFEYAGYAAYVMKSLDDFKEEANHQNNCVARSDYDERMAHGDIIICSLRKDNEWITCEVDDGRIEQMYGKNNSNVDEDIRIAFQEFLNGRF